MSLEGEGWKEGNMNEGGEGGREEGKGEGGRGGVTVIHTLI